MSRLAPILIAAALAGVLMLQWLNWPPPLTAERTAAPTAQEAAGGSDTGEDPATQPQLPGDRESYASILERPIFRPDRKPEPPDDQPEDMPPASDKSALDALDLTAVLITPALVSAWIEAPGKPKPQRLRIGDDLDGWQVREIRDDRVLLERQGETYPLILRDYSKKPADRKPPAPVSRRPAGKADSPANTPAERHRPAEARPNAPRSEP